MNSPTKSFSTVFISPSLLPPFSYLRTFRFHSSTSHIAQALKSNTVEPPNNGHGGDKHFVHCLEVVPLSEVEMYGQLMEGGKQFVHCREVVLLSLRSVHYRRFYCIDFTAGHGFKLSPVFGKLLAQLVLKETPSHNLHPFRVTRFITDTKSSL